MSLMEVGSIYSYLVSAINLQSWNFNEGFDNCGRTGYEIDKSANNKNNKSQEMLIKPYLLNIIIILLTFYNNFSTFLFQDIRWHKAH